MHKKYIFALLLAILCFVFALIFGGSDYYFKKGLSEYKNNNFLSAIPLFERSVASNPNNPRAQYYLVKSLSKVEPIYSVQEKLYNISQKSKNIASKELANTQIAKIRENILADLSDNYIYNAIQGSDIIHWDIQSFPLKIYFENLDSVPPYYKENIFKAMDQWKKSTGFIEFILSKDAKNADIYVKFKDIISECAQKEKCSYTIAYTEPIIDSKNVLKRFNFVFYKTNPNGENYSSTEIYNTVLHELGHTLGIIGHSDNPNDVMFSNNDRGNDIYSQYRSYSHYLSMRDLKTLVLLYRLKPTISNVKNLSSENFIYPPIILGSKNEILNKKVLELKDYIKKYPKFAAGYINIAAVYGQLGENNKAFDFLDKAQKLASNEDEVYLVHYNRSVIYFNSRDYKSAYKYALLAKSVRNNQEIQSVLDEIEKALKQGNVVQTDVFKNSK
mgnify:CR=1 FL=1